MIKKIKTAASITGLGFSILLLSSGTSSGADSGVMFHDIVADKSAGIGYSRQPSPGIIGWNNVKRSGLVSINQLLMSTPTHTAGAPGISIFDYDNDGDPDVYVTNGPGKANSLYSNQFKETGHMHFIDVAMMAGVELTAEDATGTCAGDIDNDGDIDLMVVAIASENHLFENNGNGTFNDITQSSNSGGGVHWSSSCTMGDANNDGLVDIAIANTYESWEDRLPLLSPQFAHRKELNQLFLNEGQNSFKDISESSGFANVKSITWGIVFVDIDGDGDADLVVGDDQGPQSPAKYGGVDFGWIRIYQNDGNAKFTDITEESGTDQFGAWMGISVGDVNGDGLIDIFGTNVGDYLAVAMDPILPFTSIREEWNSAVFIQSKDGHFTRMDNGTAETSTFGWGSSMKDYDNDGDTDIIYYGGLDFGPFVDSSNPGSVLNNNGSGDFSYDAQALSNSTNHNRRSVKGVAVNDLNNDGFVDIVSVASQEWPQEFPLMPYLPMPLGGQFDEKAVIMPTMFPVDQNDLSQGFVWSGMDPVEGTLSIEMSDANNGNNWVKIVPMGTFGLTNESRVNRSGLGATFSFTSSNGNTATAVVVSGGNYASTESTEIIFGMGDTSKGTLEVLWPGGVRNKLYHVSANQTVKFPEIPCSYDDTSLTFREYSKCVWGALNEMREENVVGYQEYFQFGVSALRARLLHQLKS